MSKHLVDMKLSQKQAKDASTCDEKGPRYPYGLSINLDSDSMKKLGFDELPAVGTKMIVVGLGTITHAGERRSQDGVDRDMSIQLEMVEIEPFVKAEDETAVGAVSKAIRDA